MQPYNDIAWANGAASVTPLSGATVTVRTRAGAVASLFSDDGVTPTGNPITAGSDGEYSFYAANGAYTIEVSKSGYGTDTKAVVLYDPEDDLSPVSAAAHGAVAGGSAATNTAAIQAALDTGRDVFVPGADGYYEINAALTGNSNQRLFGEGLRSQIRQTTSLANVVQATGKTGFVVENLYLYAPGDRSSYATGAGVIFFSGTRCKAVNVTVGNHRGGGVVLYNTNDSTVEGCTFINSPVLDTDLNDTYAFADIANVYSSSRNTIRGNHCISGQGTGVLIQTIASGNACDDNVVTGNVIKDAKVYGIVAYRNEDAYPSTESVNGNAITGNVVDGVAGSILSSVLSTYPYGAGIYLQGAEESVVSGNTIRNTHSYARTFAETLAPGAIGATNLTRCTITGNSIEDVGMFGIHINDGNDIGEPVGAAVVSGNAITNCTRGGIDVVRRGRIAITGNVIDTTGDSGIEINNIALREDIVITGNIIANVTGTSAIEIKYADGITVSANHINTASGSGISAANSEDIHISDNLVRDHTVYGIQIASTSSRAEVVDNHVVGTGSSTAGIKLDVATVYGSNRVELCTSLYAGSYGPYSTLTANSTAPSVANGTTFITANTVPTTITNFASGTHGQEIVVVIRDANTTLDFSGSNLKGNAGVDRAMANNDAIRAVYNATLFAWWVTIIAGS